MEAHRRPRRPRRPRPPFPRGGSVQGAAIIYERPLLIKPELEGAGSCTTSLNRTDCHQTHSSPFLPFAAETQNPNLSTLAKKTDSRSGPRHLPLEFSVRVLSSVERIATVRPLPSPLLLS
jgi:hypothetical protein